ncbi:hypothetical protein PSTG_08468 [Puccinia striiformis f. sp. tritici PST-78]|uniref:Uncharacterized protein n=1 Tax=Puccinia striiformis f. sp. tritici PST-78 TaxID=1165861 RepID=A0A0L0VFX5_9BASI|nr:hypothetical protein PSTG_08468 [Puccinia striiformis f. sp. tritici PST-78]
MTLIIRQTFLRESNQARKKIIDTWDSYAHTIRLKRGFVMCSVKGVSLNLGAGISVRIRN